MGRVASQSNTRPWSGSLRGNVPALHPITSLSREDAAEPIYGTIKLWNTESHGTLQTISGHTDQVMQAAWNPKGLPRAGFLGVANKGVGTRGCGEEGKGPCACPRPSRKIAQKGSRSK